MSGSKVMQGIAIAITPIHNIAFDLLLERRDFIVSVVYLIIGIIGIIL